MTLVEDDLRLVEDDLRLVEDDLRLVRVAHTGASGPAGACEPLRPTMPKKRGKNIFYFPLDRCPFLW